MLSHLQPCPKSNLIAKKQFQPIWSFLKFTRAFLWFLTVPFYLVCYRREIVETGSGFGSTKQRGNKMKYSKLHRELQIQQLADNEEGWKRKMWCGNSDTTNGMWVFLSLTHSFGATITGHNNSGLHLKKLFSKSVHFFLFLP